MSQAPLPSGALSAFFGSMSAMLGAGIQLDEAVHMLADSKVESSFRDTCAHLYRQLSEGSTLSAAMEESGAFPPFACAMVRTGETSGRTEEVLQSLDTYYDEEDATFAKLKTAVTYPAALLCIISLIMVMTVIFVLPVFVDVYRNMSGLLTTGSFGAVTVAMVIGWVALAATVVVAAGALMLAAASRGGKRQGVLSLFERMPVTRGPLYQLALARFSSALATYLASGIDSESAMAQAGELVTNERLRQRVQGAHAAMTDQQNPLSLGQAIAEFELFEPVYARMMQVGNLTGSTDEVLAHMAQTFFEDSLEQIDQLIARIEPLLTAFMTVAVGATLIAAMLPLVGIMLSIG